MILYFSMISFSYYLLKLVVKYLEYVRFVMRSNWIICKLGKMSGCFMPKTQKGLRIITTYLFSPLQYTILLIFSGKSEEVERKSKRATVQAHSGINNYSSVPWFCSWLCLSITFANLISFSLDWKMIHRIS